MGKVPEAVVSNVNSLYAASRDQAVSSGRREILGC